MKQRKQIYAIITGASNTHEITKDTFKNVTNSKQDKKPTIVNQPGQYALPGGKQNTLITLKNDASNTIYNAEVIYNKRQKQYIIEDAKDTASRKIKEELSIDIHKISIDRFTETAKYEGYFACVGNNFDKLFMHAENNIESKNIADSEHQKVLKVEYLG